MTRAHTPEPWEVRERDDDEWPAAIVNREYWQSTDDDLPDAGSEEIALFTSPALAEDFLARYKALAGLNPDAVPELVEAMQRLEAYAQRQADTTPAEVALWAWAVQIARAALAKAASS